jgi:hypothetical protein
MQEERVTVDVRSPGSLIRDTYLGWEIECIVYTDLEGKRLESGHFRRLRKNFTKHFKEDYILGKMRDDFDSGGAGRLLTLGFIISHVETWEFCEQIVCQDRAGSLWFHKRCLGHYAFPLTTWPVKHPIQFTHCAEWKTEALKCDLTTALDSNLNEQTLLWMSKVLNIKFVL